MGKNLKGGYEKLIQLLAKLRYLGLWPVWGMTFLKTPLYIRH